MRISDDGDGSRCLIIKHSFLYVFLDLKPASNNKDIFNVEYLIVTSNVSNVQDHIQQRNASARKEQTMSAMSSVEATTLPTTRVA
jgi:hypothetical protein